MAMNREARQRAGGSPGWSSSRLEASGEVEHERVPRARSPVVEGLVQTISEPSCRHRLASRARDRRGAGDREHVPIICGMLFLRVVESRAMSEHHDRATAPRTLLLPHGGGVQSTRRPKGHSTPTFSKSCLRRVLPVLRGHRSGCSWSFIGLSFASSIFRSSRPT